MMININIGSYSGTRSRNTVTGVKGLAIFGIASTLFGLVFAGIALHLMSKAAEFREKGQAAEGVVTEVRVEHSTDSKGKSHTKYHSTIQYQPTNGSFHTFSASSQLSQGEHVPVLYLPEHPEEAMLRSVADSTSGNLIFLLFGLVSAGIGVTVLIYSYKKVKEISWLKAHGSRIKVRVIGINSTCHKSGRPHSSTYQVVAQGAHPRGGIHQFKSETVSIDPGDSLIGQDLEVLVDPRDPKRYYFEVC